MKKRNFKRPVIVTIGLFLLLCLVNFNAVSASGETLSKVIDLSEWNFDENGIYTFKGNWEFYPDRYIYSGDFERGENLGVKKTIQMPNDFYNQNEFERKYNSQYGTLRTHIKVPLSQIGKPMSVRSTLFYKDAQIYANGQALLDESDMDSIWRTENQLKPQMLGTFIPKQQDVEMIIHFSQKYIYGNTYGNIMIGSADQILNHLIRNLLADIFIFSALIVLAVFNMAFFLRRSRRKTHQKLGLYFALLVAVMAIRIVNSGEHYLLYFLPNIPSEIMSKLGYWAYYLLLPIFILFACEVRKEMLPEALKKVSVYALAFFGMAVLMVDSRIYIQLKWLYQMYFVGVVLLVGTHLWRMKKLNSDWANRETASMGLMMIIFVLDSFYISGNYQLRGIYMISIVVFMFYVTYMISNIYANAVDELEEMRYKHDTLEMKLSKIEAQYRENLDEKQKLCDEMLLQKDVRLVSLEKIAHEMKNGLVIINREHRIIDAYGKNIDRYFGSDYAGKRFIKYFLGEHTETGQLFEDILNRVTELDDQGRINTYLSLIPKRVYRQGRWNSFEVKLLRKNDSGEALFIILINDVSKLVHSDQLLEKSQRDIKLLKSYAKYDLQLKYLILRVNQFCSKELNLLMESAKSPSELIENVIMRLERFGVWYEAFGFERTYNQIKHLIGELDRLDKEVIPISMEALIGVIQENRIAEFDYDDRKTIEEYTGSPFETDVERVSEMLKKPRPFKETVDILGTYCDVLAKRYGKVIEPIVYLGADFDVALEKCGYLLRTLSRLFEAIIVHNIEYTDERVRAGKSVASMIRVDGHKQEDKFILTIEDDGAGININTLKDSLYKLNLLSFKEIVDATEKEILPFIFEKGIYYRESDNEYFGIGDGLWMVKEVIERFGGRIEVESSYQNYCRFTVEIPMEVILP